MTQEQLATKYNCTFTAQEIVNAKENDPVLSKTQIRPHPELPNRKDLRLFLCWDESVETDEHDTVVESMFSQFEDDGRKPKRTKKTHGGTESSQSSEEDSDSESSSSSGKTRKTKKKKMSKKDKKAKDKKREREAEKKMKDKEKQKAKDAKKEAQEKQREVNRANNKLRGSAKHKNGYSWGNC